MLRLCLCKVDIHSVDPTYSTKCQLGDFAIFLKVHLGKRFVCRYPGYQKMKYQIKTGPPVAFVEF
jgi:hypothetical protein